MNLTMDWFISLLDIGDDFGDVLKQKQEISFKQMEQHNFVARILDILCKVTYIWISTKSMKARKLIKTWKTIQHTFFTKDVMFFFSCSASINFSLFFFDWLSLATGTRSSQGGVAVITTGRGVGWPESLAIWTWKMYKN